MDYKVMDTPLEGIVLDSILLTPGQIVVNGRMFWKGETALLSVQMNQPEEGCCEDPNCTMFRDFSGVYELCVAALRHEAGHVLEDKVREN